MFQQHGSFETLEVQIKKNFKVPGRCQEWRLVYSFSAGDKGRLVQARGPVYFAIQSINFYPMIFDGHSLLNRYNLKIIGHTSQYPEVNGDKGHSLGTEDRKHQG